MSLREILDAATREPADRLRGYNHKDDARQELNRLAPELAALALDMGEALAAYYNFAPHMGGCSFAHPPAADCDCGRDELDALHDALLARLDQLGNAVHR